MYEHQSKTSFKSQKKCYIRNKLVYTYLKENNMLREMRNYSVSILNYRVKSLKYLNYLNLGDLL